jgi:FkbM family methyltransferase
MSSQFRSVLRNLKKLRKSMSYVHPADLLEYWRLIVGDPRLLIGIRVRQLGGRLAFGRPATEDHFTMGYVFRDQYHLSPAILPDAPLIMDLGTNCGYTVVHYKHLYPRARVVGVELDAGNFAVASRNVEGLEGVDLLHAAVSHQEGTASYNTLALEDAFRIAPPVPGEPVRLATVEAVTIPALLERFALTRVDFAKIDIEGEEVNLFKTGADLSWLDAVDAINMEVHAEQPVLDHLIAVLEACGFRAWRDDHHWSAIMAVRRSSTATAAERKS